MKTLHLLALAALAFPAAAPEAPPFNPQGRPNRNRPGPWDNDVLVYRLAADGGPEKLATFERAGVPTVARLKDGRFIAAFQHFPAGDDRNFDRVAVRFSEDEGRTWSKPEPIAVEGLESGLARPFDPTLVPLPDGRIRLYFTSNRSPDFRRSTPAIYSAISSNGISYVFEPGVRFAVEGRIVIDCAAALHNGVFHLIVPENGGAEDFMTRPQRGQPPRSGTGYHAVSRDGLKFERVADVTLVSRDRWLGNMQSDGGRLVFFGTGPGPWPVTSADGVAWEREVNPVRVPGADPGAVKLRDGSWLVVVTGPPRPGTAGALQRRPTPDEPPGDRLEPAATGQEEPPGRERGARDAGVQPPPAVNARPAPRPGADEPPLGPRFDGVFLRIPSRAAGDEGVAASVLIPRQPRFANGAPVVINVTGGVQAGSARGRPEYVGHGFVEIHFAFPGGGAGDERSGGTYDFRGPECIRALADVIRFATGRIADKQGRRIGEVVTRLKVLTNNAGLVGSSHGGNACGLAMAKYGDEFPNLAWYASMESPYGEGAANVELGGHESGVNPACDPVTGALDLSRLAWSGDLSPGLFRKPMLVSTRELKGAFFFDLSSDGRFSREDDFPANCFVGDAGGGVKAWYSPRILAEAEKRQLVRSDRPAHIPTLAEARDFWSWRDAAPSIPDAVRRCTNVAVIVYANEHDHVQADPAHTHILEQVEGFRKAGARFVRLNPDRAYVERVVPAGPRFERDLSFADNPAGKTWTRANIAEGLEPSAFPLGLFMQAAVCELADRAQAGNWSANLDAVLYPDTPRAPALPPQQRRPGLEGGPGPARRPDRSLAPAPSSRPDR
ncbi:MAG: hypothetical protein AAB676_01640 [Verrucomicrobiota bacterium]